MHCANRTYSDVPADPPQNVTLETASSKSLIVRWEPPPPESQNGIITGYKLRWRKKGGEPEVVTTDGSRRLFAITGLKNGKEYQVTIKTLVNLLEIKRLLVKVQRPILKKTIFNVAKTGHKS